MGKSEEGNLIHLLWPCDKVQQFWANVYDNLFEITEIQIPFNFRLFVMDNHSAWTGQDKHIKSISKCLEEMACVAAFEKIQYKQLNWEDWTYMKKSGANI